MINDIQNIGWPGWEVTRLIGRGSFGAVYEMHRSVFSDVEKAALKVITIPQAGTDIEEMYSEGYDDQTISVVFQKHLESIVAEYSMMKKMNGSHNIVNCDDIRYVQHEDGIGWDIFIKMELLTPLGKALPKDISEETVIKLGIDMCAALELCKQHGIIHRDIKPQNIFVSPYGDYKLGDFGIAKTVERTMGGTKIGTYKFMAPEVHNNQPYGAGADMYSLGLVLYWLLNERRTPFLPLPPQLPTTEMEDESRRRRFSGEQLPKPAHGSDDLQSVVLKACAFAPDQRFKDATEMRKALEAIRDRNPVILATAVNTPSAQENTAKVAAVAVTTGGFVKNAAQESGMTAELHLQQRPLAPDQSNPEKEKSKKGLVAIIAACLALALLLCLVIPQFRKDGPEDDISLQASTTTTKDNTVPTTTAPTTAKTTAAETEATEAEPSETESTETEPTETEPPKETLPVQLEWSGWSQNLPDYVTTENYFVEERTLYRSQKLETKSSTDTSYIDGWEMYNTAAGKGDFGAWSDWSTNAVSKSENRDVQTETRYRYSNKETTTSSSSSMSGWDWYDTTYSWGSYGSWSDWSTSSVSGSDSRKVETKTQYRYRDISYSTEYTSWGGWSGWQDSPVYSDNLTQVETRTVYEYGYFSCPSCGNHWHGYGFTCFAWGGGCGRATIPESSWTSVWGTTPQSQMNWQDWHGTGHTYAYYNGERVFRNKYGDNSKTQYRYSTRSTYQEAHYGNWSSWSDSSYNSSSTREVESRKVYRYCDRSQIATYHFYRWGNWSGWSTNAVSSNNDRKVETATFYRYRDRVNQTTYYFRRWTSWSDYSTNYVAPSDTVQVETKTEYRFKSK